MINLNTGREESFFHNIQKYTNVVWTRDLPFNITYRLVLTQMLERDRILNKNESCYPIKLAEVLNIEGIEKKIPETTRRILLAGLLAMEEQLAEQEELYGEFEEVFFEDQGKKKDLIHFNRENIYNGFRAKMNDGLFFILTGNKKYNGDYSFKDEFIEDLLANYSTLPMLEKQDYSEFNRLFIKVPIGYSVRHKKSK